MTCTATHIQNGGRWRSRRPGRAVVLGLLAGLILIGSGAQSFIQAENIGGQARQYTPAQRVELFQDGVDAYRLGQYRKSYDSWLPLARAGDHAAQRNIAHLWAYGFGVQKSLPEALPWLVLSAEGGIASSYTKLGMYYANHPEITRDYEKAAGYFYQAARQNDHRAQYNLGLMYEFGLGVETDLTIAAAWYKFAALAGHARAIQHLASLDIAPDISDGFPPAPESGAAKLAGAAQPRVIDREAQDNQRSLDNLVSAISRSAPATGETGSRTPVSPLESTDDLLSELAPAVSKRSSKGRKQLPASAFIDDTARVKPAAPALEPETIDSGPAPEPEAVESGPAPEPLSMVIEPAEPATPAEPIGIERVIPASTDEAPTPVPAQADQAITEAVTPAPLIAVEDVQTAGSPRPKPALPEERPTVAALPDPEELAPSRPDAMPVNVPEKTKSSENTQKERILLSYGNQTHLVIQPAIESLARGPQQATTPMAGAPKSPTAASVGNRETHVVGATANPIAVSAGDAAAQIVDATFNPLSVKAGNAELRALPQEQSPVSVVPLAIPGEMLVATDAMNTPPDVNLPLSKPSPAEPAAAGKSVQTAALSKDKRPASRPARQTASQSNRAAALAAYKRGDLTRAHRIWSALSAKGDVVARFWLGRLYNRGEGVPRDPVRAYELFKSAARKGYSPAVTALANVQARMTDEQLKALEQALSSN